MYTKCAICNAIIHEDGTTDQCAGECERAAVPEANPLRELNFHEDPITSWEPEEYEAHWGEEFDEGC